MRETHDTRCARVHTTRCTHNPTPLCFLPDWPGRPAPHRAPPRQPFTPDDHSKVVPLLPIPNRKVKRLRADDSGRSSVKVGHRQALIPKTPLAIASGVLLLQYASVRVSVPDVG